MRWCLSHEILPNRQIRGALEDPRIPGRKHLSLTDCQYNHWMTRAGAGNFREGILSDLPKCPVRSTRPHPRLCTK